MIDRDDNDERESMVASYIIAGAPYQSREDAGRRLKEKGGPDWCPDHFGMIDEWVLAFPGYSHLGDGDDLDRALLDERIPDGSFDSDTWWETIYDELTNLIGYPRCAACGEESASCMDHLVCEECRYVASTPWRLAHVLTKSGSSMSKLMKRPEPEPHPIIDMEKCWLRTDRDCGCAADDCRLVIDRTELSRLIGVPSSTLSTWKRDKYGPQGEFAWGHRCDYRVGDIRRFILSRDIGRAFMMRDVPLLRKVRIALMRKEVGRIEATISKISDLLMKGRDQNEIQ